MVFKIHKNIKNVSRETLSIEMKKERCYNYFIMIRGLQSMKCKTVSNIMGRNIALILY